MYPMMTVQNRLQVEPCPLFFHSCLPLPGQRILAFTTCPTYALVYTTEFEGTARTQLLQTSPNTLNALEFRAVGRLDTLLRCSLVPEAGGHKWLVNCHWMYMCLCVHSRVNLHVSVST